MAKKYLKRVEEDVARFGNVRDAYEYEVGLLLERIIKVEQEENVIVSVQDLLPNRAMDIAGGERHYREYKRWIEDVVRIRKEQILQHARPKPKEEEKEDYDTEQRGKDQDHGDDYKDISNPEPQQREYEDDFDYDDEFPYDEDYNEPEEIPPSLADIQLENLGRQLEEYGDDSAIANNILKELDDAIEKEGKQAVGERVNANFNNLRKNIDYAIQYEEDRHAFNYFMREALKVIRGSGYTKEENIAVTESSERHNVSALGVE